MVKTIAFCSDKNQTVKTPIARHFAAHLQTYFGPTTLIDAVANSYFNDVLAPANYMGKAVLGRGKMLSEHDLYLEQTFYNQDAFCANPKRSELRITPRSKPATDAVLQTPTGATTGGDVNDFQVLDAGFGCSQLATAKGADPDELVVVLEDTVSRYSEAYQFIKNGLKQTGGRSFSILVNHGFCGNKAAEKYDRLNDLLTSIGGLSYRFIGFVPSFKNDPKFKTLETMALQNIAHELLDLKYDDKIHKIPKAMFEGALN